MRAPLDVLSLYPPHDGTLASLVESRCASNPDRPFLRFEGKVTSWSAFQSVSRRAADMLWDRGIRPGDRVAAMAPNSNEYVALFFALARVGAILVPLNPEFGVEEARYVLRHAEVSAVLATPAVLPTAREALAVSGPGPWYAALGGDAEGRAAGVPRFSELVAAAPACDLPTPGPEAVCLILYTSGTTGFPKGVMHTQRNFALAGEGFVSRMHLQPEDRLLCVLPLFHINALFYSLGGAVAAGASLALTPRFSASRFWRIAAEVEATEVNIIAAIGNILARRPRSEFVADHSLSKVYGAPITPEIYQTFREVFGVPTLIEGYGMTEIPGACNLPFEGPHVIGSMGRAARHPDPALAFAELRVVDERGADLPDGEVGELWVRTPIVMKGYFRDPEQSRAAFHDGWFKTGDLVRRDADGFFFFVARQKDIIRKRGENIAGAELDRVIGAHPDVQEAAAIAVPSELGEDEILVAVVAVSGASVDAATLAAWCETRLASIKRPRYVVFVDELPQTPTHRVAKFKLKNDPELLARATDLGS